MKNRILTLFLIVIALVASFGAGFFTGKNQVVCRVCQPEDINFSLFWEAYKEIQDKFVDPAKIDTQKIIYGAIGGMIKSLDDPYTTFFNPEDTKKFKEDITGRFEGIGIEIGKKDGQLQVIAPLEGTPAQRAGLKAGDKILQINHESTVDLTIDEAVDRIRGPQGTKVVLTITREGLESTKDIEITREVIQINALSLDFRDFNNRRMAIVKINQFSEQAGFEFAKAARNIIDNDPHGIILDLRNNPGGYLEISQEIAEWFLSPGSIVTIEDFGGKEERIEYKTSDNARLIDYPVVVIINQGSASASEILAGALRDNREIKLVGEKSFGKGSIQELAELQDGSFLKITVANWLTPKGELITGKGLEPDIQVGLSDEDFNQGKDPQLDKAIEIIQGIR